jgi:FSR family fosmidomycin resistance protein-like MFS transporter
MKSRKGNNLGNVLTMSFSHLIHDIPGAFLAPILPLLIEKFGMTVFMAGLLDIFRRFPSLINPFLGLVADRMRIRYFIIFSPGVTAVTMSLLGIAPTYTFLAVLLIISGISSAIYHVTAPVMVKQVSLDKIGRGMSFYMLGGELARTLGPLIILGAVSLWGLEGTWRLVPFGIAASGLLYIRLKDIQVDRTHTKKGDVHAGKVLAHLAPFFISLAGILLFQGAMKSALTIYLPTYLTSKGISLWIAGLSLSVLQFSGVAGTFLAGTISDRIGRKNALLVIAAVNPLLMWLFMVIDGIFVIPVLILNGLFLFGSGPVMLALVHDLDVKRMSFVNGIYMTLNFILSSLTVLAVGFAADRIGLDLTYKLSALTAVGSLIFVIFLRMPAGQKMNNEENIS